MSRTHRMAATRLTFQPTIAIADNYINGGQDWNIATSTSAAYPLWCGGGGSAATLTWNA